MAIVLRAVDQSIASVHWVSMDVCARMTFELAPNGLVRMAASAGTKWTAVSSLSNVIVLKNMKVKLARRRLILVPKSIVSTMVNASRLAFNGNATAKLDSQVSFLVFSVFLVLFASSRL